MKIQSSEASSESTAIFMKSSALLYDFFRSVGLFCVCQRMPQAQISMFWQSVAAFAMTASFVCLVLLLTTHIERLPRIWWVGPVLLCSSLGSAVILYTLSQL